MAQPNSNNATYFSHDADMRNDIKVKALRKRFGHTGYAVWCFILESLTDSNNFEIEYYTDINRELYAADFEIEVTKLDEIIAYCAHIGLLQVRDTFLFSDAHKRRFQEVSDIRKRQSIGGKLAMQKRWNTDNTVISPDKSLISPDNKKEENRKEKNKTEKKKDNIVFPYQEIVALWNSVCVSLTKVKTLNDNRRTKIRCRLTESGCKTSDEMTSWAEQIFKLCEASDFLRGGNKTQWKATFDWVFENSTNWVKVSEGNYSNDRGANKGSLGVQHTLGVGEYITPDGKRTYGSGRANIPMSAQPRPSDRHQWSSETNTWILL